MPADARTEDELLAKSTKWVDYPDVKGFLPFRAANALVASGRWKFKQATCWGYVIERRNAR